MDSDAIPEHIDRPHIRRFVPVAVRQGEQQMVVLQDPLRLVDRTLNVAPQALQLLARLQGEKTLAEVADAVGAQVEQVRPLIEALDQVGLLWGPTAARLETEKRTAIESDRRLPKGAAFALGERADECRARLEGWLDETEDPEVEGEILAIVAPHLDYGRGSPIYASAYRGLVGTSPPDRVVVLGTNHFGIGDGVVLTEWGFRSPLGDVETDMSLQADLRDRFGERAIADQLDHIGEHSIQLHLPWIQHLFGEVPVIGALVPDPLSGLIEDDGKRVGADEFIDGLRAALDAAGGRTLVVASSDLSHVGPQFGEPRKVDEERCVQVETHDREMIKRFLDSEPSEFLEAVEWNRNPTRWCSVGNMVATKRLVAPKQTELIDYRQAVDDQGVALVSAAAMVMTG